MAPGATGDGDVSAGAYDAWSLLLQVERDGTLVTVALPTADLTAGRLAVAHGVVDFD